MEHDLSSSMEAREGLERTLRERWTICGSKVSTKAVFDLDKGGDRAKGSC